MTNVGENCCKPRNHVKSLHRITKSQSPEYRRLYQQWDQLIVRSRVLWRYYAQPYEILGWFQSIVQVLKSDIVKEAHDGLSKGFTGQGTLMMSGTGVPPVVVALPERHLPLHNVHQWGQSLRVTLCR